MRILSAVVMLVLASGSVGAEPPFRDLPWIWPHILTSDDPSALREVVPNGKGKRRFWESWRWQEMNVWLFTARYRGGVEIEIQVSPEWRRRRVRAAQREWEPGSPPWESPEYDERTEKERMLTEVGTSPTCSGGCLPRIGVASRSRRSTPVTR